jgi:hypothetical protein
MKRIILCAGLLAGLNQFAVAHEGHDHADEKKPAAIVGNTPQRLPDGAVFLPKSAQRGMGVLTLKTAEAELPKTIELAGSRDHGPASRRSRPGDDSGPHRSGRRRMACRQPAAR